MNVRSLGPRLVALAVLLAGVAIALRGLAPDTGRRLAHADPAWLAVAAALEAVACLSYASLFHVVYARDPHRSGRLRSLQIALGELAAFVLVPAGVGGPALRIWALRRGGMPMRTVLVRSVSHLPVFNAPYVLAAFFLGLAAVLHLGRGRSPAVVALAPAVLVLAVVVVAAAAVLASRTRFVAGPGRVRSVVRIIPDGLRDVAPVVRRPAALIGAFGFWVGDCAVLWAAFRATGSSVPIEVVVLAYMLGQLGNLVPIPGGIGGVEPVMLAVFAGSGVATGTAAAAIIVYRAVALGLQGVAGTAAVTTLVPAVGGGDAAGSVADTVQPGGRRLKGSPASSD